MAIYTRILRLIQPALVWSVTDHIHSDVDEINVVISPPTGHYFQIPVGKMICFRIFNIRKK